MRVRIRIEEWRGLPPTMFDVDGLCLLTGAPGSGKTRIIEAIGWLRDESRFVPADAAESRAAVSVSVGDSTFEARDDRLRLIIGGHAALNVVRGYRILTSGALPSLPEFLRRQPENSLLAADGFAGFVGRRRSGMSALLDDVDDACAERSIALLVATNDAALVDAAHGRPGRVLVTEQRAGSFPSTCLRAC